MRTMALVGLMLLLLGKESMVALAQDDYWLRKALKARQPEKKIEYFTKSIETESTTAETYILRGDVYWNLAIDAAYNSHLVVIVFDKDKADFHNAKLMYGKADDDYTKALELDPDCAKAYFKRSDVHWQLGLKEKAIADLTELIAVDPENTEAFLQRAFIYQNDFRDFEKALADASRAIEIDPDHSAAYRARGYYHYRLRQNENSIADFNKSIEINPNDAYAYFHRGDVYRRTGQYEKAISDYCRTIELDRKNFMAFNNRGLVYVILTQYEKALKDFKKAISLNPSDFPNSYNNAGYVYLQQDKIEPAIKYFNKCLSIEDKYFPAYLNLALAYDSNGNTEKAQFNLERARSSAPFLEEGMDSVVKLNKDWYYWTEQDQDTLTKMLLELN